MLITVRAISPQTLQGAIFLFTILPFSSYGFASVRRNVGCQLCLSPTIAPTIPKIRRGRCAMFRATNDDSNELARMTNPEIEKDENKDLGLGDTSKSAEGGTTVDQLPKAIFESPSIGMMRFLVVIAAAIYGTNFAIVKLLDQQMPLALSAAVRFSLAAVACALAVVRSMDPPSTVEEQKDRFLSTIRGGEVGLWYCIGYLCQATALREVDASYSAFFNALAVIVVPILDVLFKGKPFTSRTFGSVGLAVVGVGLLQLGPSMLSASGISFLHMSNSELLCLAQAIFFGIGYWRLGSASIGYPKLDGFITAGCLAANAFGAVLYAMSPFSGLTLAQVLTQTWWTSPYLMGSLLWTGLISTAFAIFLETVALKVVSSSELTLLMTTISLWGSAFAYFTIGEVLPAVGWVGGIMILAGCVLTALPKTFVSERLGVIDKPKVIAVTECYGCSMKV